MKISEIAKYTANQEIFMEQWHNREKAAATNKKVAAAKREEAYKTLQPVCRICTRLLTFSEFEAGRRTLCPSKECRSKVNQANGKKQDKTKISSQIRTSEKWIDAQRESLTKRQSRVEAAYGTMLSGMFSVVERQKPVKLADGSNRFIDFCVNGVFIEIDGPYHTQETNAALDIFCAQNSIPIIRVSVTKHWLDLLAECGNIIKQIQNFGDVV